MHSHQAEIYGVFSIFIFIKEYCNYFILTFESKVEYYYDNLLIVNKLKILVINHSYYNEQYKTTDHDAVLKLWDCLPPNVITFHVKGYENQRKQNQYLIIPETLNIKADQLIGPNTRVPLEKYILSIPMVMYINYKYTPNNFI